MAENDKELLAAYAAGRADMMEDLLAHLKGEHAEGDEVEGDEEAGFGSRRGSRWYGYGGRRGDGKKGFGSRRGSRWYGDQKGSRWYGFGSRRGAAASAEAE